MYPEDRLRFDELVYRRYTTGSKTSSTTAVSATCATSSSRIDHYDTRHVSGRREKESRLNYQFSFISHSHFFMLSTSFRFYHPSLARFSQPCNNYFAPFDSISISLFFACVNDIFLSFLFHRMPNAFEWRKLRNFSTKSLFFI